MTTTELKTYYNLTTENQHGYIYNYQFITSPKVYSAIAFHVAFRGIAKSKL